MPIDAELVDRRRIDDALVRLDAGQYGSCLECAREISERRLRALPFAVRCQACEDAANRIAAGSKWPSRRAATGRLCLDVLSP